MAIAEAIPTVKTMYLCDLDVPKAEAVAAELQPKYPNVKIIPNSGTYFRTVLLLIPTALPMVA